MVARELESAPRRPKLQLVGREDVAAAVNEPTAMFTPQCRDIIYRRIRDLSRMYWLQWLERQETAHVGGVIECLSDDELATLRDKMERARECRVDGIGFDDAGLVRENFR